METSEIINEMRAAVKNNTAKPLTMADVNRLHGKKIRTIYFGYNGQDHTDEFVVGKIVSYSTLITNKEMAHRHADVMEILTDEGRQTFIRSHPENHGEFTCSDSDRTVYFIEL